MKERERVKEEGSIESFRSEQRHQKWLGNAKEIQNSRKRYHSDYFPKRKTPNPLPKEEISIKHSVTQVLFSVKFHISRHFNREMNQFCVIVVLLYLSFFSTRFATFASV